MERIALDLLAEASDPIGSVRLAEALDERGIPVAEATAGRFLRVLDRNGYTRVIGRRGRVLTEDGRMHLARLRVLERQREHSAVLMQAVDATDVNELIDLLYVRRAVEPEVARHAAVRASEVERRMIQAAANCHMQNVMEGFDGGTPALEFHRIVAHASHNRMLSAVVGMLVDPANDPLSKLLDLIAVQSGAHVTFAHEHRDIVEAICLTDPAAAEQSMRAHIDHLIALVECYRGCATRT